MPPDYSDTFSQEFLIPNNSVQRQLSQLECYNLLSFGVQLAKVRRKWYNRLLLLYVSRACNKHALQ